VRAFIILRDRVTYARRCAAAMMAAGLEPVIVDHGSTWPSAVRWLDHLQQSGVQVLYRGGGHPRALWEWPPFRTAAGTDERYVVTDPDVVPSHGCPRDWPAHLAEILDANPGYPKAGLALRTDNIPGHYSRRQQVIDWEAQFWREPVGVGTYKAPVDTTLALHQPLAVYGVHNMTALRTGPPYVADHLAWHEDLENLPAENLYYYQHAEPGISYWAARGHSAWGN
jgi:hypothetical protein